MNPMRRHIARWPIPRTFRASDFIGAACILVMLAGALSFGA